MFFLWWWQSIKGQARLHRYLCGPWPQSWPLTLDWPKQGTWSNQSQGQGSVLYLFIGRNFKVTWQRAWTHGGVKNQGPYSILYFCQSMDILTPSLFAYLHLPSHRDSCAFHQHQSRCKYALPSRHPQYCQNYSKKYHH